MPHGNFNWNELQTNDVEKAKAFYTAAVGWTFEGMPMPDGTYWIAKQGDARVGGITEMNSGAPVGTPSHWFPYLEVDDIDARVKTVSAGGGKVVQPPFDIPGVGRIAVVSDATGAMIGWITPKQ